MQSFLTSWYGKDRDGTGRLLNLRLARGLRNARAPLFLPSQIEAVAPENVSDVSLQSFPVSCLIMFDLCEDEVFNVFQSTHPSLTRNDTEQFCRMCKQDAPASHTTATICSALCSQHNPAKTCKDFSYQPSLQFFNFWAAATSSKNSFPMASDASDCEFLNIFWLQVKANSVPEAGSSRTARARPHLP